MYLLFSDRNCLLLLIVDKNLILVQNRTMLFCCLIPRGISGLKLVCLGPRHPFFCLIPRGISGLKYRIGQAKPCFY